MIMMSCNEVLISLLLCREYEYGHIDLPVKAAKAFAALNDKFNFVYVSRMFASGQDHLEMLTRRML